jgi:sulfite reductase (NADPH) flavoprotein alpha-component
LEKLAEINGGSDLLNEVYADFDKSLRLVEIPESWAEVDVDATVPELPTTI